MKDIYKIDEIPTVEEDPEFWKFIENPVFKININFLILNEIRKYQPEQLSDIGCRTQLAKIKAWQELLDFPSAIKTHQESESVEEQINEALDK